MSSSFFLSSCHSGGVELCIRHMHHGYPRRHLPLCSGVCVSVCVDRAGELIITPASEVDSLWGRQIPELKFASFFCLLLTFLIPPFSPFHHSSESNVTSRCPHFSSDSTGHRQEWWSRYREKSYWLKSVWECAKEHEGRVENIFNEFQLFFNRLKLMDTLTIRKCFLWNL